MLLLPSIRNPDILTRVWRTQPVPNSLQPLEERMVNLNLTNFLTVGLMALGFLALARWAKSATNLPIPGV